MKTLIQKSVNEIVIKNSRFICILVPLISDDITSIMDSIKEEYPKATHYCYAYLYQDRYRSSDDGEPGGTAGMPILNVLQKEGTTNLLCVVVRYFGGIKLGAGGLVRAYTKSVTETLKNSSFQEMEKGYKIKISFSYEEEKNITYILHNSEILTKDYVDMITYTCFVNDTTLEQLTKYHPEILENCFIKKLNES